MYVFNVRGLTVTIQLDTTYLTVIIPYQCSLQIHIFMPLSK